MFSRLEARLMDQLRPPSLPIVNELGAFSGSMALRGLPNVPGEFGKSPSVTALAACNHDRVRLNRSFRSESDQLQFYDTDLIMKRLFNFGVILTVLAAASGAAATNRPTQFWNLTKSTISEFYLAP